MKKIKKPIKTKGIKKPKFIIYTDKDGTLNLNDKQLSNIFNLITSMGGMVVPTTGRTVGDIKEDFKNRKITLPKILIGDNGANVYATEQKEFILKQMLEQKKVIKIIEKFIEKNGDTDLIRYTDGSNIYASKADEIEKYYKKSKTAKLHRNIEEKIMNTKDITKITLAGSKKQMEQISEYVEKLEFWSDMDKTKFPNVEDNNYRLDIAPKNISKGNAIKVINENLKPEFGYMCVGNGWNDVSMFKQAINDDMIVGIMGNADIDLIEYVKKYSKNIGRGKVVIVPETPDKANKWILKVAKFFREKQTEKRSNMVGKDFKKEYKANINLIPKEIKKQINKPNKKLDKEKN